MNIFQTTEMKKLEGWIFHFDIQLQEDQREQHFFLYTAFVIHCGDEPQQSTTEKRGLSGK